ncbi:hypothetical protein ACNOYE_04350 [Nannocystaceae bacterium ST9]
MRSKLSIALLLLASACPKQGPREPSDPIEPAASDEGEGSTTGGGESPDADSGALEPAQSCEAICGSMHDCLLARADPPTAPHEAAALELDCLQLCVESGPALADSRFAGCASASTCDVLLPCMREAWPSEPTPEPEPNIEPTGGEGCRQGCERLGQCFGSKPDEVDECARGCERQLDLPEQKAFGQCVEAPDCVAVLTCMQAFPGAT